MGFSCGIVGLPNVGKSTLFNALTASKTAQAANFPFCTIDPNNGRVAVPDSRLDDLAALVQSKQIIPTWLDFIDIAGLVSGASRGEGLGNRFLSHIRDVDAIVHVVRCFENTDITHVEGTHATGRLAPVADIETVETELMLADLSVLEHWRETLDRKKDKPETYAPLVTRLLAGLQEGHPARDLLTNDEERNLCTQLQLLTTKPTLYVCNVDEDHAGTGNAYSSQVKDRAHEQHAACVITSVALEAEISLLPNADERTEFLQAMNMPETGLEKIIRCGYAALDLVTFFTCGVKEVRAWTCPRGTRAPAAGGIIHSDFEQGFIRAEVISYADYMAAGGEAQAKAQGLMRQEGRDYVMQDGDVVLFRFNV